MLKIDEKKLEFILLIIEMQTLFYFFCILFTLFNSYLLDRSVKLYGIVSAMKNAQESSDFFSSQLQEKKERKSELWM